MIRAEEAKKISEEKNSQLRDTIIPEAMVLIEPLITKNAENGNYNCLWYPTGDYVKWIKDIQCSLSVEYGYNVSLDYDETRGYYLNIWW